MRMAGRIIPTGTDDDALAYDPLSDLLFTMVAILLLAFMAILPGVALSAAVQPAPAKAQSSLLDRSFNDQGRAILPYLATGAGLRRSGETRVIATSAILDDSGLRASLVALAASGAPAMILIAADGLEAAFEFEAVAAASGITTVRQIRLTSDCKPDHPTPACGFDARDARP